MNLLAGEPGEKAAGGTLALQMGAKGAQACDVTLLFEAPDGAAALVVDACAKGDAALPLVQAAVQLVRKDGELLALVRVNRSRPNLQEQLTSVSRLHFVRAPASLLKSSGAGTPRRSLAPPGSAP